MTGTPASVSRSTAATTWGWSGALRTTPWEPRRPMPSSVATSSGIGGASAGWNRGRNVAGGTSGSCDSSAARTAAETWPGASTTRSRKKVRPVSRNWERCRCRSGIARCTSSTVLCRTPPRWLRTRSTVASDSPAWRAISRIGYGCGTPKFDGPVDGGARLFARRGPVRLGRLTPLRKDAAMTTLASARTTPGWFTADDCRLEDFRAVVEVTTDLADYPHADEGRENVLVDECHHVPAAAFEHAVRQIPARRWLGLTATPYRRDQLDDLISLQLGPIRHTLTPAPTGTLGVRSLDAPAPEPVLHVHPTGFRYTGDADPAAPGGIAAIYRDLVADDTRTAQVVTDLVAALTNSRHCLVLTQWTDHLDRLTAALRERGHDPVVLRGGMGAKARAAALARLQPRPDGPPLLAVATGPYVGEGFDCPALDTLFLAAPIAFKARLVQYAGRVLRPHPGKTTAEVHDYHDAATGVLASSLAKRAPGYTSLGFPDPRRSTGHVRGISSLRRGRRTASAFPR